MLMVPTAAGKGEISTSPQGLIDHELAAGAPVEAAWVRVISTT